MTSGAADAGAQPGLPGTDPVGDLELGIHPAPMVGEDSVSRGRRDLVRVIVDVEPAHLDRPFDYLLGDAPDAIAAGWRVEVNFSGRRRRALVIDRPHTTDVEESRLRPVKKVLGEYPWVTPQEMEIIDWAAHRWAGSRADVIRHALPGRTVAVERAFRDQGLLPWPSPDRPRWVLPEDEVVGTTPSEPSSQRSGTAVYHDATSVPRGWRRYGTGATNLFAALPAGDGARMWRPLADEDVAARLGEAITACVAGGRDAMVVVPDSGSRVAARLVELLRIGLGAHGIERHQLVDVTGLTTGSAITRAWMRARTGQARVVIGERRICFWPLAAPGLFVVLDEANPALKERRNPRHHVREVLLERARRSSTVALVTGRVPSAQARSLTTAGRMELVAADRSVEVAASPRVSIDDHHRVRLGRQGIGALREAVAAGHHGVVLAARRGEGRAMVCANCGDRPTCPTCASSLAGDGPGLACPTCGWRTPRRRCSECGGSQFVPLAAGTQRLAQELRRTVKAPVVVLEGYNAAAPPPPAVLVMTRGSVLDLPPGPVGAVVLGDLDALVRRPAVNAPEDTLRLAFTLGSWLGAATPAHMVVVTREPDGTVPVALRRWDPDGFWREEETLRAPFPPARSAIAITAPTLDVAEHVAEQVAGDDVDVLGPVSVPTGHRLLVLTATRVPTVAVVARLRTTLSRQNVTLAVDVDPVDLV